MSQNDMVIANAAGATVRNDINLALQAQASSQSGATAPSTIYANQLWYDTSNDVLKQRNEANSAWISLFTFDQSGGTASPASSGSLISNALGGCTLSNGTDTAHEIDIAAGICADELNAAYIAVGATTLDIENSGDGGLDTGSVAADTWYHVLVGHNTSSGNVVGTFSTTLSKPAAWDDYRRIGSVLTDSSSNILGFTQHGDEFLWDAAMQSVLANPMGATTAISYTLDTPDDVKTVALLEVTGSGSYAVYISALDTDDETMAGVSWLTNPTHNYISVTSNANFMAVRTNTSSQVRARCDTAANGLAIHVKGYVDLRGKE